MSSDDEEKFFSDKTSELIRVFSHSRNYFLNRAYQRLQDEDGAECVVTDTFLKAIRNLEKYNKDLACMATLVDRIFKNTLIDQYRSQMRRINHKIVDSIDDPESHHLGNHPGLQVQPVLYLSIRSCFRRMKERGIDKTDRKIAALKTADKEFTLIAVRVGLNPEQVKGRWLKLLPKLQPIVIQLWATYPDMQIKFRQ